MRWKFLILFMVCVFVCSSIAVSQVRTGTITGKVTDEQGGVVPGVTVTLIGEQGESSTVTIEDGTYRFRGLAPGTYNLRFELPGFATFNREGIVVSGARTLTVNAMLQVASVAETITVTGESPLIDVKQTTIGAVFEETALDEVPSSTDAWGLLSQSPGVRMRAYDVGGSHKSQQSSYESFGIRGQNQINLDGVITTEGSSGTIFYYDYYAHEEVKISGSGADVEMQSPGVAMVFTVKSGTNTPSAMVHFDFEDEAMIGDNLTDDLAARGFTGNQVLSFYEFHGDYGGPIVKDKLWIFGAINKYRIDTQISGVDRDVATDLGTQRALTAKGTWAFTEKDKFIGYITKTFKNKPFRGISAAVPPESARSSENPSSAAKLEWQRVWNTQMFTNVLWGRATDTFPRLPKVDPKDRPPRLEVTTDIQSGAGWEPFESFLRNPHVTVNHNIYIGEAAGSHDLKFGYLWRRQNSNFGYNAASGPIRYYDRNGEPYQVRITDAPNVVEIGLVNSDRNLTNAFWAQDTWTLSDRLTVNVGLRFDHQHTYYKDTPKQDQAVTTAEWYPWLEGVFSKETVPGADVYDAFSVAPRLGMTYDVLGTGKTVAKVSFGRYYFNLSYNVTDDANPGGRNYANFEFRDLDGNKVLTQDPTIGQQELGRLISRGGGSSTEVDQDMKLPFSDELQLSLEQQFAGETAFRVMYVYKSYERHLGTVNIAQAPFLTVPFQIEDPSRPGRILDLWTTPEGVSGSENLITTVPDSNNWKYNTFLVSLQKRFIGNFFIQGAFDYQWRNEARNAGSRSTSPLTADPIGTGWYQNHSRDVATIQDNTNWGFKALARYQLPYQIALATNIRVQSGWPYSEVVRLPIYAGTGVQTPGAPSLGTKTVFVEDIKNNRSETVPIWDVRVDKTFNLGEDSRLGTLTIMADLYNILNSNAVSNFFLTTGNFRDVIAALPPVTFKVGIRWRY